MKIGIVGAMAQEVATLSSQMENKTTTQIGGATIYQGKINGKEVALLQSGIGKVAAAMGTTALLQLAQPDVIINTGSAGGVAQGLKVGDVVISTQTAHHDADVTAFGYEKGQLPACPARFNSDEKLTALALQVAQAQGQNVHQGLICSGDSFIHGGEALTQIKHDFLMSSRWKWKLPQSPKFATLSRCHLWWYVPFLTAVMEKPASLLKNFFRSLPNNLPQWCWR